MFTIGPFELLDGNFIQPVNQRIGCRIFDTSNLGVGTVCVNDTHHATNFQPIITSRLLRVANQRT